MPKFLSLILMIAALAPLAAQEDGAGRGIQLRGFAFAHFEGIDKLELRHEEKPVGELFLPTGQLRGRTPVSARTFSYGVTESDVFRLLGRVALPEVGRDFIVIFAPVENGYRAFAVRADDPNFRGDDTHLFNFTKHRLGIQLGTARRTVPPWENARMRPAFPEDATFYQAMFTYEKDGTYVPFSNTRWPVNSNTKSLLFVFQDAGSDRLMYRAVTELAGP